MNSSKSTSMKHRGSQEVPPLTRWQYEALFALLDECAHATDLTGFKTRLLEALAEVFRYPNTTFLSGATFPAIFVDDDAVTAGRMTAIRDEYHARWRSQDIFRQPEPAKALTERSVLTHTQIDRVPAGSTAYLREYLYHHKLYSATAVHLRLAHNGHALIGIFDSGDMEPGPSDLYLLSLAARQLSLLARSLPSSHESGWSTRLTPRQRQVGDLVAAGLSNDEIAKELQISIDAAKKHVSRIFGRVEVRSRSEFVREHILHSRP